MVFQRQTSCVVGLVKENITNKNMNKVIEEQWEQEQMKREIGTKEDEIEGLKALLK